MKNLHNKEKKFAEILSDLDLDINTDDLWDSIEHRLPDEPAKRRFFFWRFGGLLMFLVLVGGVYMYTNLTDIDKVSELGISKQSKNEATSYVEDNEVFQKSAALEAAIDKVLDLSAEDDKVNNATVPKQSNSLALAQSDLIESAPAPSKLPSSKIKVNVRNAQSDQVDKPKAETENLAQQNTKAKLDLEMDSPLPTHYISRSLVVDQLDLLSSLPHNAISKESFHPSVIMPQVSISKTKLETYFQFGTGFNINSANYFIKSNEIASIESVELYETNLPGLTASLSGGVETSKGWRYFGGIKYIQLVNRYRNQDFTSNSRLIEGIQFFDLDRAGNSTPTNGMVVETTTRHNDIEWYRQFHNIDLFVGIGKELIQVDNWSISAEVALSYNIVSPSSGYIFAGDFSAIEKYSGESGNPFQAMGFGNSVSLQVERNIGNNFSLFCAPFYSKYYRKLDSDSFYTTNNSQWGLQLGLKYYPRG